jgi:uncharacterized protein (TIGR03435 family)
MIPHIGGRMFRLALILAAIHGMALAAAGPPQQSDPSFEVASVKPGMANGRSGFRVTPAAGQWLSQDSTLVETMQRAYPEFALPGSVVGGPSWARDARFTIDARSAAPASAAQLQAMVRHLLTERFKLRTHVEQQPVDLYALTVAREDGRLGRGLRPTSGECAAARAAIPRNPFPAECPSDSGQFAAGTRISERGWLMSQLVVMLQTWMDRRVIDRTGLADRYDMDFEFDFATVKGIEAAGATAASVFTALQDHLGLKLTTRRETLDVLVIDSAEQPTPD